MTGKLKMKMWMVVDWLCYAIIWALLSDEQMSLDEQMIKVRVEYIHICKYVGIFAYMMQIQSFPPAVASLWLAGQATEIPPGHCQLEN